jgi:hypothetical protein
MPLCALKIGEHVWKVVGKEYQADIILEYVDRYNINKETREIELDKLTDCVMVFVYVRTNHNGLHEYKFVDCGKVVKANGKGIEGEETRQAETRQGQEQKG